MKHVKIMFFAVFFTIVMAIMSSAASYSPNWYQENGNWKIRDGSGNIITNTRLCDSTSGQDKWYIIDTNGNMVVCALIQDNHNNYYSLETHLGEDYGSLRCKSGYYDGVYLDIDSSSGAIKNQEGINTLKNNRCGIFYINHNNFIYTKSFMPSVTTNAATNFLDNDIFNEDHTVEGFERVRDSGELLKYGSFDIVKQIVSETGSSGLQLEEAEMCLTVRSSKGCLIFLLGSVEFSGYLIDPITGEKRPFGLYKTAKNIKKAVYALC